MPDLSIFAAALSVLARPCPCVRRSLLCVLLMAAPCGSLLAQTPWAESPLESPDRLLRDARSTSPSSAQAGPWLPSVGSIGQNALDVAAAPFTLSPTDRLRVLGAAGLVTGLVATADAPATRYVHRRGASVLARTTGPLAAPGRLFDRVGPDRVGLGAAGVLAVGGLALQNRRWTRTSVRVVEALAYTKLVVSFGKGLVSRARPFAHNDPHRARPGAFTATHADLSMPSGHTARAFAVAAVLATEFDRWYVELPVYGAAASVALERVRSGDHWLSDVVVGGAIGTLIGRSVVPSLPQPSRISYTPILTLDRLGLIIRF